MTASLSSPRSLIINAPFGLVNFPHLGTSLVKAAAIEAGFDCDVWYATLAFAKRIGMLEYMTIERSSCPMLLPERPFARALFPDIPSIDVFYEQLVEPFGEELWPVIRSGRSVMARDSMRRVEECAFEFVQRLEERSSLADYDVIAFSSSYGQQLASLAMAKRIKELHPKAKLAIGGANSEGMMGWQIVRSFPFIDYAFSGDGDVAFPRFLEALRDGQPIKLPGVFHRGDDTPPGMPLIRRDLDALPDPDFTEYYEAVDDVPDARAYQMGIPVEGSRGCWWGEKHHCTFCGLNGLAMGYRSKSPDRFMNEVERLVDRWGETHVMASDNILDHRWMTSVVPAFAEKRSHEVLFFETKANLDRADVEALADAGITHLQPGIESLSTHVLKLMDKGTTAIQNIQLLKWAEEYGISLNWNLLCGFPGEKAEDYEQMAKLMGALVHLQPPLAFARISIDRFSPYFDHPDRYGMRTAPSIAYRYVYDLPAEEIRNLAYWYFYTCENGTSRVSLAAPDYARRSVHARSIWERLYGKVRFEYRVDEDGRVELLDERPGASQETSRLGELESRIFLQCDSGRLRSSLAQDLPDVDGASLDRALEELEADRVLIREGDRFLAIAPRAERRPKAPVLGASALFPL